MIRTVYERHCGKAWLVKFPHLTHRWPTVVSVIDAWFILQYTVTDNQIYVELVYVRSISKGKLKTGKSSN